MTHEPAPGGLCFCTSDSVGEGEALACSRASGNIASPTATGFLTFHYRMQGGHPGCFCVNQQSHFCPYFAVSTCAAVVWTQETPYAERTD